MTSPSRRRITTSCGSQRRADCSATASSTACRLVGEPLMTRKIAPVAVSRRSPSVSRSRASLRSCLSRAFSRSSSAPLLSRLKEDCPGRPVGSAAIRPVLLGTSRRYYRPLAPARQAWHPADLAAWSSLAAFGAVRRAQACQPPSGAPADRSSASLGGPFPFPPRWERTRRRSVRPAVPRLAPDRQQAPEEVEREGEDDRRIALRGDLGQRLEVAE